ncbi:MAG: HIRAN domain-containing protein [Cryobacterium sp.]
MELLLLAAPLATLVFYASDWATKTARARSAAATASVSSAPGIAPPSEAPSAQSLGRALRPVQPESATGHYLPSEDWDELLVTDGEGMPTLYLQMHGGELRLTEPTTDKLVGGGNHHLRRLGIWTMDLGAVGVHRTAGREGLLQPGSPLSLVREPDNDHDGNVIAVHAAAGRPVGYVNTHTAAGMCRLLDTGTILHAISIAFGSSEQDGRPGGVKVLAASPEVVRHLLRNRPGTTLSSTLEMAY